jgi:integrase
MKRKRRRRGGIARAGRSWYAIIKIGGKYKWIKGGDTKEDAEKVLTQTLSQIDQGTYKEPSKITFQKFSELWLDIHKSNIKPSTLSHYTKTIHTNFLPSFGHLPLSKINTLSIQKFVQERLKILCPRTLYVEIAIFGKILKDARAWKYISENPMEGVKKPKVYRKEPLILTLEESNLLLEHTNPHYRMPMDTAIQTGVRAGELWALQWGDLDKNELHIQRSVWNGHFQTPKSQSSIRTIYLPSDLVHRLKVWRLQCPPNKDNLMFPNHLGQVTDHLSFLTSYFYPALKRAKLKKVSFHSLRHTNASLRIQAGQNIKFIQNQLGHSSIKTTMDVYGHIIRDENFILNQVRLFEEHMSTGNEISLEIH